MATKPKKEEVAKTLADESLESAPETTGAQESGETQEKAAVTDETTSDDLASETQEDEAKESPEELSLFEKVLSAMGTNGMARRESWPKGKMIFRRPSDKITVGAIGFDKSLPQPLKDYLKGNSHPAIELEFTDYLCLLEGNTVTNGWQATQEDIESQDWILF